MGAGAGPVGVVVGVLEERGEVLGGEQDAGVAGGFGWEVAVVQGGGEFADDPVDLPGAGLGGGADGVEGWGELVEGGVWHGAHGTTGGGAQGWSGREASARVGPLPVTATTAPSGLVSTVMSANRQLRPARNDRELRLWDVRRALVVIFAAAILTASGVFFGLVLLLDFREIDSTTKLDAKTLFDLVKLSFGVVAGAGALVALVVAYRRQRVDEAGAHREATRLHTERFSQAVEQLGSDSPAVQLGGVHALTGLADDAPDDSLRQTCIDVLCAYLQLPFTPDPGDDPAHQEEHHRYLALRTVRHTILRLIADHYRRPHGTHRSWQGCSLDLIGVTIDCDIDLSGTDFVGGEVSFNGATFPGGEVSFAHATFSGTKVSFDGATFSGGEVTFEGLNFLSGGGKVTFNGARFAGGRVSLRGIYVNKYNIVSFSGAEFLPGGEVDLTGAQTFGGAMYLDHASFSGGRVDLTGVGVNSGTVSFADSMFSGGEVSFHRARLTDGWLHMHRASFSGSRVNFDEATFSDGDVLLNRATFSSGTVSFCDAVFRGSRVSVYQVTFYGSTVPFDRASFSGGTVSFHEVEFAGGTVSFHEASFSDGVVVFDEVRDVSGSVVVFDDATGTIPSLH
ncbi:pentapeptide repeat-containing protein [Streptomyces cellulosae]